MSKRLTAGLMLLSLAACDGARPSRDAPSEAQAAMDAASGTGVGSPAPASASPTAQTTIETAPPSRLTQQPNLLQAGREREKPRQVNIYTPPAGSPERVELMNALRSQTRGELGGDAVFVVRELRSNGEWAFGIMEPQWRDGAAISPRSTPLYRQNPDQSFDGLRTEAIWRNERGRWQVFAHNIGSTDVWWLEYCDRLPARIMRGC